MFDADAVLESIEAPSLKIGGKVVHGRILSISEWLPFEPQMSRLRAQAAAAQTGDAGPGMTIEDLRNVLHRYLDAIFPRPWWAFWRKRVSAIVLGWPVKAQIEALRSFLVLQSRSMVVPENEDGDEVETVNPT